MSLISKHIFKIQFLAILVTFFALGLIDLVIAALNELNYRTNETYTASVALNYVIFNTPSRLYTYSPYIILVGVLFATGQMANDRELVIYESIGLTKKTIMRKILIAPVIWVCLFFLLGETIAPYYEIKAKETRDLAASQTSIQYGVWHKENGRFYFFNAIDQSGNITGGYRVSRDSATKTATVTSFETLTPTRKGSWLASSVTEKLITHSSIKTLQNGDIAWDLHATPELLLMATNQNLSLSVSTLWLYTKYLKEQSLNSRQYGLKFWQKLTQPFIALALVWLGITFIFGPLRQSSMGARIFTGVLVSLILNIIQSVMSPLAINFSVALWLVAIFPLLIIIIITKGLSFYKKT